MPSDWSSLGQAHLQGTPKRPQATLGFCTDSEDQALQVTAQFSSMNLQLRLMRDVMSTQSFYKEIEAIFSNLPPDFKRTDLVTAWTGMTKFASIGAALAGHSVERALRYVELSKNSSHVIPPTEVVSYLSSLPLHFEDLEGMSHRARVDSPVKRRRQVAWQRGLRFHRAYRRTN